MIAGAGALAVAVAVWGLAARNAGVQLARSTLPQERSVEALKAKAGNPAQVRELFDRQDLTDEQRRELADNLREVGRSMMNDRFGEYFNAPADERQAVLDKHIDEFQKMRKEMEARRKAGQNEEGEKPDPRGFLANRTRQERKAESESRSADEMARGMAYFTALRKRMGERGIEMPGPPGRGGPGGRP